MLSHLFAQGTNSGELFQTQADFRASVNKLLPKTHPFADSSTLPAYEEYQVVFAVVSDSTGDKLAIPFFARLNLRSAIRRLSGYGYRVAIAKIAVNPRRGRLQRLDAA